MLNNMHFEIWYAQKSVYSKTVCWNNVYVQKFVDPENTIREFDSDDNDTSVWKDMSIQNESNSAKTIEEVDLTRLNNPYKALDKTTGDAKEGRLSMQKNTQTSWVWKRS